MIKLQKYCIDGHLWIRTQYVKPNSIEIWLINMFIFYRILVTFCLSIPMLCQKFLTEALMKLSRFQDPLDLFVLSRHRTNMTCIPFNGIYNFQSPLLRTVIIRSFELFFQRMKRSFFVISLQTNVKIFDFIFK